MSASNQFCRFLYIAGFCVTATLAQAAGLRSIDIPADADGPAIHGAMWYPCAEPPGEVRLDPFTLPGVKDCPLLGDKLPLVVVSHGRGGNFAGHHHTGEVLAEAGFIVAAISHPGDNSFDLSRSDDLSAYVERPQDIKRLIDFMLVASPVSAAIDRERIGLFGFSRGGYTGLVAVGANPDWAKATAICQHSASHACAQILRKEYPTEPPTHDPRIKAIVIADPLAITFGADSLASVKVPVQLWASEYGGDGVLPHDVAAVDANLSVPHKYRVVPNSWHFSFLAPCSPTLLRQRPELCVDPPRFDRAAFYAQFDTEMIAFFRKWLARPAE
ncbi:putative hydrolase, exported protein [Bradyrhizobium sp. STM 3843]|uniref:alpha/beta hydrolase family protein n=1 Tax=Bradyrhizobium sp. STM 3843 TaxID=551947 RepID=UPI000240AE18|nr:dienelactone hydrolase [Bradyrhizobium sp. STM 3843]CCE05246.1 putative hydrolase, exported protein [Bradyrhizobium sp. STM 3843]